GHAPRSGERLREQPEPDQHEGGADDEWKHPGADRGIAWPLRAAERLLDNEAAEPDGCEPDDDRAGAAPCVVFVRARHVRLNHHLISPSVVRIAVTRLVSSSMYVLKPSPAR